MASALGQGFAIAVKIGLIARAPRLFTVQTAGCAPLARAWRKLGDLDLKTAVRQRSRFMWPWEIPPHSIAHGILDDETYDWLEIVKAMRGTGGNALVASEAQILHAHELARQYTDIAVSPTGSAGLAGLLAAPAREALATAVIFSGIER